MKRLIMIRRIVYVTLVIVIAISCHNNQLEEKDLNPNLIIRTGTVCGWCTVNDTLTIHGNAVRYVNYTKCDNSKPFVEKTGQLPTSELEALINKLDIGELKKIDLNSCNVCADGCDDWIFFDNGLQSHYIRFGKGDPKLQSVQLFIDQLNAIKLQYSKVD